MTIARKRRRLVLWGSSIVGLVLACGDPGADKPVAKWYCLVDGVDGCTCSYLRPGILPKPGFMWVDRCPAFPCCRLNNTSDESTLARCGCVANGGDCTPASPETKIVAACPPP